MTSLRLRRLLSALSLVAVLALLAGGVPASLLGTGAAAGAATPSLAQVTDGQRSTTSSFDTGSGDANPGIIPAPNSGHSPRDSGERGGWTQSVLFFLLCGAIVLIGLLVWRESHVKRRRAGAAPGQPVRTRR